MGRRYGLLAIIGLSTPFALVVETGVRRLMMPPEFEEVRAWLRPDITPWAWLAVPLALVGTAMGFALQRWLARRELKKPLRPGVDPATARRKAEFEALMLSTSAPQIPALLATFAFMFGSELLPVLVSIGVATLGVVSLGVAAPHAHVPGSDPPPDEPPKSRGQRSA